jgi:hypothetical protein
MAHQDGDGWPERNVSCCELNLSLNVLIKLIMKMLKHAGMLEPQEPGISPFDDSTDMEVRWREWLRREHIYR